MNGFSIAITLSMKYTTFKTWMALSCIGTPSWTKYKNFFKAPSFILVKCIRPKIIKKFISIRDCKAHKCTHQPLSCQKGLSFQWGDFHKVPHLPSWSTKPLLVPCCNSRNSGRIVCGILWRCHLAVSLEIQRSLWKNHVPKEN